MHVWDAGVDGDIPKTTGDEASVRQEVTLLSSIDVIAELTVPTTRRVHDTQEIQYILDRETDTHL